MKSIVEDILLLSRTDSPDSVEHEFWRSFFSVMIEKNSDFERLLSELYKRGTEPGKLLVFSAIVRSAKQNFTEEFLDTKEDFFLDTSFPRYKHILKSNWLKVVILPPKNS